MTRSLNKYIQLKIDDRYHYNTREHTFPAPTPTKPTLHTQTTENQKTQQHCNRETKSS